MSRCSLTVMTSSVAGRPALCGVRAGTSAGENGAGRAKGIAEADEPGEPDAGSGSEAVRVDASLLEASGGEFSAASLCCCGTSAIVAGCARGEPGGAVIAAESTWPFDSEIPGGGFPEMLLQKASDFVLRSAPV